MGMLKAIFAPWQSLLPSPWRSLSAARIGMILVQRRINAPFQDRNHQQHCRLEHV
jgi:hypothetical protein